MMMIVRSGSASRNRACSSMPSMPGILMSSRAISNSACWMISRASRAPPAGRAVYPSLVNHLPSESRTTSSSSTIRILPLVRVAVGVSTTLTISSSSWFRYCLAPLIASLPGPRRRRRSRRQRHAELRPRARFAPHRDFTRMLLDNARRHRQAEPGPVLIFLGSKKRVEDARQHLRRYPRPRILHAHHALFVAAIEFRGHFQATALGHRLGGVHHQPQDHLLDLVPVAIHRRQALRKALFQLDVLHLQLVLHQLDRAVHYRVQVLRLALARRLARKRQQTLYQFAAPLALPLDGLQLLRHLVAPFEFQLLHAAQRQVRVRQYAEQRIVDFVGHRRRQLADGGHLLRAQQRLVNLLQFGRLAPDAL